MFLNRAQRRMMKSKAEAMAFPRHKIDHIPGAVAWLAVGLDPEGRGTYTLHSAASEDRPLAHEAARSLALSRLAKACAFPGFPAPQAKSGVA